MKSLHSKHFTYIKLNKIDGNIDDPLLLRHLKYLDDNGIKYRLTNAKMQRGRKELDAIGVSSVPALKVGDQVMIGWNVKDFNKLYAES